MPTHIVLRLVTRVLSAPLVLLSRVMESIEFLRFNNDLQRCLNAVDEAPLLPHRFVTTLVAAEDHRNAIHPGVDPIAMLRALLVWASTGAVQGASTIEQQLVRVVLSRYERTLQRKLREQMIAIALSCKRSKSRIAMAYLSIAFYGSGRYGISALNSACGPDLGAARQDTISRIVARLKYPEPLYPSEKWRRRILTRARYIGGRLPTPENNRVLQTKNLRRVLGS